VFNTQNIRKRCFPVFGMPDEGQSPSKEAGIEQGAEKTQYMLLSRHKNAGQRHDIKIANRSFGNVAQLEYLEATVTF
jgi:hypothetical protein